jgi:hypothetical protein
MVAHSLEESPGSRGVYDHDWALVEAPVVLQISPGMPPRAVAILDHLCSGTVALLPVQQPVVEVGCLQNSDAVPFAFSALPTLSY